MPALTRQKSDQKPVRKPYFEKIYWNEIFRTSWCGDCTQCWTAFKNPRIPKRCAGSLPGCLQAVWRNLFVRHETVLELVRGADFSWKLMCGAGPGDLGGSRGSNSAENPRENRAEDLQPDCLQDPLA